MFTLDDLIKATEGKVLSQGQSSFSSASIDTRTINPDEIFFALRGTKRDGHEFVNEALKKASGAVISKDINIDFKEKTVVKVNDTLLALQNLARYLRRQFKGKVIAVIGSNGKTTTKELISEFLKGKYKILKTDGNLNNHIGVPLCISRLEKKTEFMVLELGTNRRGDIRHLCEIVYPDYAVITNIGFEHIEGFGSIEGVREGELEILSYVNTVFVNGDDKFLMEGLKGWKGKIITFGLQNECDFSAQEIKFYDEKTEFILKTDIASFPVKSNLIGLHNVYNTLAAVSVAVNFGISKCIIERVLENFYPVSMRGEILKIGGLEIFFDGYNANPSSMKAAIEELARRKKDRDSIAVLGDMLELGDYTEEAHVEIGKLLKDFGIDSFIGVGKFMKNALRYFDGDVFDTVEQAGQFLKDNIKGSEVILIKGSRAMKMERIVEILRKGEQN